MSADFQEWWSVADVKWKKKLFFSSFLPSTYPNEIVKNDAIFNALFSISTLYPMIWPFGRLLRCGHDPSVLKRWPSSSLIRQQPPFLPLVFPWSPPSQHPAVVASQPHPAEAASASASATTFASASATATTSASAITIQEHQHGFPTLSGPELLSPTHCLPQKETSDADRKNIIFSFLTLLKPIAAGEEVCNTSQYQCGTGR